MPSMHRWVTLVVTIFLFGAVICQYIFFHSPWWALLPATLSGTGSALNYLVVCRNGWRMPVRIQDNEINQFPGLDKSSTHQRLTSASKLPWLADIIHKPQICVGVLEFSRAGKMSIGDILILCGFYGSLAMLGAYLITR